MSSPIVPVYKVSQLSPKRKKCQVLLCQFIKCHSYHKKLKMSSPNVPVKKVSQLSQKIKNVKS